MPGDTRTTRAASTMRRMGRSPRRTRRHNFHDFHDACRSSRTRRRPVGSRPAGMKPRDSGSPDRGRPSPNRSGGPGSMCPRRRHASSAARDTSRWEGDRGTEPPKTYVPKRPYANCAAVPRQTATAGGRATASATRANRSIAPIGPRHACPDPAGEVSCLSRGTSGGRNEKGRGSAWLPRPFRGSNLKSACERGSSLRD
jgi:hypothetical protein